MEFTDISQITDLSAGYEQTGSYSVSSQCTEICLCLSLVVWISTFSNPRQHSNVEDWRLILDLIGFVSSAEYETMNLMSLHQRWAKSSALIVPFSSSNIYYDLKYNVASTFCTLYILYLWLTVVLFVRHEKVLLYGTDWCWLSDIINRAIPTCIMEGGVQQQRYSPFVVITLQSVHLKHIWRS